MREKPNYYAVLIAEVRYDNQLGNFSKLLYAEISALCNKEGYCWASNNYFAALYEVKELTVTRAITQLVERGYLIRELNNVGGQDTKRILRLSISEMISPVIKNDRELGIKNDTHNTINLDNIKT
jgi:DNA-binding transcriptional regulator YhcF (GntR family)